MLILLSGCGLTAHSTQSSTAPPAADIAVSFTTSGASHRAQSAAYYRLGYSLEIDLDTSSQVCVDEVKSNDSVAVLQIILDDLSIDPNAHIWPGVGTYLIVDPNTRQTADPDNPRIAIVAATPAASTGPVTALFANAGTVSMTAGTVASQAPLSLSIEVNGDNVAATGTFTAAWCAGLDDPEDGTD